MRRGYARAMFIRVSFDESTQSSNDYQTLITIRKGSDGNPRMLIYLVVGNATQDSRIPHCSLRLRGGSRH